VGRKNMGCRKGELIYPLRGFVHSWGLFIYVVAKEGNNE